jgi:hypothetical protein
MAAKAWGAQSKAVEEAFFHNDAVSLCLLMNRRAKTMRIVDFRAGPSPAKRQFVLSVARREGLVRVYTLVERDEVGTWVKMGFRKEGNIPGFYKRSDALILGCDVPNGPTPSMPPESSRSKLLSSPPKSGLRMSLAPPALVEEEDEDDEEEERDHVHEQAERSLAAAKRQAKELSSRALPKVALEPVAEPVMQKAVGAAVKAGKALTGFEAFGRDVQRSYFTASVKGAADIHLSTETQACFGNAFLELLAAPKSDADRLATAAVLRAMGERLLAEGTSAMFCLSPSDDVPFASTFVVNGFRRTGLLRNHIAVGGDRKHAIIWSKKLANPAE